MRRSFLLAASAVSLGALLPTAASAGGYGRPCCAPGPFVYTYPGPTYTYGGPHYFNSNLYYYRGYYPYTLPRDRRGPWRRYFSLRGASGL